ncbi:MAG: FliH/SctL family protein [Desulforhopalus sp.]
MSLSKYYKDSSSFQPEGLIKREDKSPAGWQPSNPSERLPFQSQPPLAVSEVKEPPQAESDTKKTPPPEIPAKNDIEQQQTIKEDKPEVPPKPEIDLSQYLEIAVADKRIEDAYQKGLKEGKTKIEQDFESATKALLNICQQLDTIRDTIISNSSSEIQESVLAIAERVLRISVREQNRTIVATIEEALQRAVKSDEFFVYIHPDDYETVAENAAEIVAGISGLNKIVIKKDITVERGGAKIESDNCTIDATIVSQFDIIREEIKKNL